jgi:hypothetical protein
MKVSLNTGALTTGCGEKTPFLGLKKSQGQFSGWERGHLLPPVNWPSQQNVPFGQTGQSRQVVPVKCTARATFLLQ